MNTQDGQRVEFHIWVRPDMPKPIITHYYADEWGGERKAYEEAHRAIKEHVYHHGLAVTWDESARQWQTPGWHPVYDNQVPFLIERLPGGTSMEGLIGDIQDAAESAIDVLQAWEQDQFLTTHPIELPERLQVMALVQEQLVQTRALMERLQSAGLLINYLCDTGYWWLKEKVGEHD